MSASFVSLHIGCEEVGHTRVNEAIIKNKIRSKIPLEKNLKYIDVIESDHAPHTLKEKRSVTPPFGVPGVETTLPLLLTSMYKKRITLKQIIEKCHDNPKRIFNLPEQKTHTSRYEILNTSYEIRIYLLSAVGLRSMDGRREEKYNGLYCEERKYIKTGRC